MSESVVVQENPFGRTINSGDIVDTLSFFDSWEDRYKYIIDLGKELPPLDESLHTDGLKVKGCQSQVWIATSLNNGKIQLSADSDAFIVKGLLGVVLAAYNNKTPADVLGFDIDAYFDELELLSHLTPTRGNGLRAVVTHIRGIAQTLAGAP